MQDFTSSPEGKTLNPSGPMNTNINQNTSPPPPLNTMNNDNNNRPSEHVPYARFKEANDQYRNTEQQMKQLQQDLQLKNRLNQELSVALAYLQNPAATAKAPQQQDPKEQDMIIDRIYSGMMDKLVQDPVAQNLLTEVKNQVFTEFPALNSEKGRFFVETYAKYLDETLPGHVHPKQLFAMAAQEIHDFMTGKLMPDNNTPPKSKTSFTTSTATHLRDMAKFNAFTEGAGNLVPQSDPYQAALKKAQKTGKVDELIRLKIQRLNHKD